MWGWLHYGAEVLTACREGAPAARPPRLKQAHAQAGRDQLARGLEAREARAARTRTSHSKAAATVAGEEAGAIVGGG